jgi:cell division protein FtsI (penicillin-binding protein 3)
LLKEQARLPELAKLLNQDTHELQQKLDELKTHNRRFTYLQRHMNPLIAQKIDQMDLQGVWLQREYRRYYPDAEVMSQLIGFTDIDDVGREGLELIFDDWLRGEPGREQVIKDSKRRVVGYIDTLQPPEPGKKLVLSIDRRIQYLVYRALKSAVVKHQASSATAVVLDVRTGEILAMASQPAGNPNNRFQRQPALFRNRAVADLYEPGSTLKPFAVAAALEKGIYEPHSWINTSPGRMRIGRYTVKDIHNYGTIDVSDVIIKSSNVGVSKIAQALSSEELWQIYTDLGFGSQTDSGLPSEQSGLLRHFSEWSEISHITQAFGYGLSVTALQLALAYAVLAADGVKRPVTLLRHDETPRETKRVLSIKTSRQIKTMLEAAVSGRGTGSKAAVPGYRVAGKTGTARKVINGKYALDRYRSLFAGMVPAGRPRLVMVIILDDARDGAYYGGEIAAPVFKEAMTGALHLLNIPPDAVETAGHQKAPVPDNGEAG